MELENVSKNTADALRKSVESGAARNVDDIVDGIIDQGGAYSTEYDNMYTRYVEDDSADGPLYGEARPAGSFPHRDYSAEADEAMSGERATDSRISRKMAPSIRETYDREVADSQRPEFGMDGSVRYPSYGVGESGERVVFDADWENQAKEEANRFDSFMRGGPLRADPSLARQFQFTGAAAPPRSRGSMPPEPEREIKPAQRKTTPEIPAQQGKDPVLPRSAYSRGETYTTEDLFGPPNANSEKEFDMDFNGVNNSGPSFPSEGLPLNQKAADAAIAQAAQDTTVSEPTGLSPEARQNVDNAVLEAFSSDLGSDIAFKERWKDTVEQAKRRKEQMALEAQQAESKQRAQQLLEEKTRRVAEMEQNEKKNPPPAQKGSFTPPPDFEAAIAAHSAESLGVRPMAEKLDPISARKLQESTVVKEKTIRKTRGEKLAFSMRTRFSKEGFKRFCRANFPTKGDGAKESIRKIVKDISFVALMCALVYLAIYGRNYFKRIKDIETGEATMDELDNIPDSQLDDAWASLKAKYPDVSFPEGMNIKFAELYAISSDVVGWLKIENTKISTVLLQTTDDDYYLYRDIYKKYSRYGNPYVKSDCKMGKDGMSKNTIIYGHNTHDHLIFNRLEEYMTVEGYLNAPIITLDTLYETTKWKIFAVMLTNADEDDNNGYLFDYLYSDYGSDDAFLAKMNEILARSMIHTGVDIRATDKTIMLYTCYRSIFSSGRLVIVARQLRDGESEEIDKTKVYFDTSAIFPAAYYTGSTTTYAYVEDDTVAATAASTTAAGTTAAGTTAAGTTDAPSTTEAPATQAPETTETEAPTYDEPEVTETEAPTYDEPEEPETEAPAYEPEEPEEGNED